MIGTLIALTISVHFLFIKKPVIEGHTSLGASNNEIPHTTDTNGLQETEDLVNNNSIIYEGCYQDNENRTLPTQHSGNLTKEQCRDKAKEQNHKHFGLQYWQGDGNILTGQCFSGNELPKDKIDGCKSGGEYNVGGGWENAVYTIPPDEPVQQENTETGHANVEQTETQTTTTTTQTDTQDETNNLLSSGVASVSTTLQTQEECGAVGDNSVHNETCKTSSYNNSDFASNCAIYTGRNEGIVGCKPSCCTSKTASQLEDNRRDARLQMDMHDCQLSEFVHKPLCRRLNELAGSKTEENIFSEQDETTELQNTELESREIGNSNNRDQQGLINHLAEFHSGQHAGRAIDNSTQPVQGRQTRFTRNCNEPSGFFTDRPSGWPFAKNSNKYDNHLTGCNCPPCKKYENKNQVL